MSPFSEELDYYITLAWMWDTQDIVPPPVINNEETNEE